MKFPRILVGVTSLLLAPIVSQAVVVSYTTILNGPSEAPPNASPGTGVANVIYDSTTHLLYVSASFTGLTGTTTAAHIHGPVPFSGGTAGVITTTPSFVGFPLGVTSGNFSNTLDLTLASSFNPAFVTAQGGLAVAEAVFVASLAGGTAYFNIHTGAFPGGEIRGFFVPTGVPDGGAATIWLLMIGLSALAAVGRHLRRDAS